MSDRLPPPFDPGFYARANPDLDLADEVAARRHWEAEGRGAGRVASPLARREDLVGRVRDATSVLEIGPFCRPVVDGPGVDYLDVLDAAGLRARAAALGLDPAGCPPRIHHVGTLAEVAGPYEAVVSSHAIEHQPDLVRHLQEVARLLEPGGRYWLIVPDKRYCFDHFLPESSIAGVLAAWHEERRVHAPARIVEHAALTTHNDPARHWVGDHGAPAADRADQADRLRTALADLDAARGGYVDVHAWQFTPDSFRTLMASLADLGLSAFDATVYDTPRGANEFCAVLERRRPARRSPTRQPGTEILFFQSADPFRYAPMLAATAPNVVEYCRRHGFGYESYVGVRRGRWPWQACYNRILLFADLVARGYEGWAVYLDADAWIADLDFDLRTYLADKSGTAAILAHAGVTEAAWDINDGVCILNLGHPQARRLVAGWRDAFLAIDDAALATASDWIGNGDQDLIQRILRDDAAIAAAVRIEGRDLINSRHARFIRQHLRSDAASLESRIADISAEVEAVMRADRLTVNPVIAEDRVGRILRHPVGPEIALVEAAAQRPDLVAASRAIACWTVGSEGEVPVHLTDLAAALDRGDADAVAETIAGFGRSPAAQGQLGGPRQHRRAETDPVFRRQRALRTHDALVSLAEAVGAVTVEHPEAGRWGFNVRRPTEALADAIAARLGIDLAPPNGLGAYLGIDAGQGRILHLRMIEALHSAWRIGQVSALLGLSGTIDLIGGIGLRGHYAHRLGLSGYRIHDRPVMAALQAALLPVGTPAPRPLGAAPDSEELLFNEETLPDLPPDEAVALLRNARAGGVRAILSVDHEAQPDETVDRSTAARLVEAAGGFRLVQRTPHFLRAGFVEEIFVAAGHA